MQLDLLLVGGRFITGDPHRPRASRMGVWQGRIVGFDDEIDMTQARRRVDLKGATVVPGFHDAHCHTAWFGLSLRAVDLSHANDIPSLQAALAEHARVTRRGDWVHAVRMDHHRLGRYPSRDELDAAVPHHPVAVRHTTGHAIVANSEALRRAGLLDGEITEPPGGRIVRDARGVPTGVLEEQAQQIIQKVLLPRSVEEIAAAIGAAGEVYLREGITSITEAGIGTGWIGHSPLEASAYQLARDTGRLRTRTTLMVSADVLHEIAGHTDDLGKIGLDLGLRTGFGDDMLRLGAIKVFTDGSLLGRTARVSAPFCDHDGQGYLQSSAENTCDIVRQAHDAGWQVALHAIGDCAIDLALDAIEQAQHANPRPGVRHRIEHGGMIRPDQLGRIASLGVVVVTQPGFVATFGEAMATAIGRERVEWTYRHANLIAHGIVVAGSSDRPVATGAPLPILQAGVERRTERGEPFGTDESVAVEQALRSYTYGSSYAAHCEDRVGTLRAGMLADLAILDADITTIDTASIGGTAVLATVLGGEFVYDAGGFIEPERG